MAESEIYASPERILDLAEKLIVTTTSLRAEITKVEDGLNRLGSTWRDEEYQKFKRTYAKLSKTLEVLVEDVRKREPELKDDARMLLEYLRKTAPNF